jgi:hypothetical protein
MYPTTHRPIIAVLLPMFQKMETLNHLTISAFANVKADISIYKYNWKPFSTLNLKFLNPRPNALHGMESNMPSTPVHP